MFREFKISVIIAVAAIITFSCNKKIVNPNKEMKQIFYTQSGHPYELKTITKQVTDTTVLPITLTYPVVLANMSINPAIGQLSIEFQTPKKIIPVSACFSWSRIPNTTPDVDIQSIYYSLFRKSGAGTYSSNDHLACLSKAVPLSDKLFYASNQLYGYSFKYGQAVYNDNDFIDVTTGATFTFKPELANALTNTTSDPISIPAGAYTSCVTFTYFELQ